MRRRPPRSTRTDTRFPYTTLFRSRSVAVDGERRGEAGRDLDRLADLGDAAPVGGADVGVLTGVVAPHDPLHGLRSAAGDVLDRLLGGLRRAVLSGKGEARGEIGRAHV